MEIDNSIKAEQFETKLKSFWELSGEKILNINRHYNHEKGSPVYTVKGRYTTRGWTEWTQGFEFGSALLQFDATEDDHFLKLGKEATLESMTSHIGHFGVHDHGFNNVSTYGNLLRLMTEGEIADNEWERRYYQLALKLSGAVQAKRWTEIPDGGYIYSFNGPHSLFVDTVRTVRSLIIAHELGFYISDEHDSKINLLSRTISHLKATARYSVFYGKGRDSYDELGRTAHESVFNINDGRFRSPATQQGYSGYSTWTRGLAWAMTGFAEQLEYFDTLKDDVLKSYGGKDSLIEIFLKAAKATCDFYITNTPTDGIPYWDTGAPGLSKIENYLNKASNPYNDYEPIDSSAAAIGSQGLLRLGQYLRSKNDEDWRKYWQAGLTVLNGLFDDPYLSRSEDHQGLILHSIYHRPNGWDYIPPHSKIPHGESSMWGDYHAREVALMLQRIIQNKPHYTFFSAVR